MDEMLGQTQYHVPPEIPICHRELDGGLTITLEIGTPISTLVLYIKDARLIDRIIHELGIMRTKLIVAQSKIGGDGNG